MTPLDIPRLDWEPYLANSAVAAAYGDLKTSRTVALHSRSLVPNMSNAGYCAWRDGIHIFIDKASVRVYHSTVHELLHGILMEQGYHKIANTFPTYMQPLLSNEMQHPEIFRRMKAYGLDMALELSHWDEELNDGMVTMLWELSDRYAGLKHFPRIYTFFFFQNISEPYLARYGARNPTLYQAAQEAYESTKGIGFTDVTSERQSLEIFRSHWLQYCERYLPNDDLGARLAGYVRDSAITPLMTFVKDQTAEEIMDLLRGYGLQ